MMDALTRLVTSLKRALRFLQRIGELEARCEALEAALAEKAGELQGVVADLDARVERHTVVANRRHAAMCGANGDYERRS